MSTPEKPKEEFINIRVRSTAGGMHFCRISLLFQSVLEEVFFKIKKHTQLKKLMSAYCARENLVPNAVRFLFARSFLCVSITFFFFRIDGNRIQPTDTPEGVCFFLSV